jgi:hypothetical protein
MANVRLGVPLTVAILLVLSCGRGQPVTVAPDAVKIPDAWVDVDAPFPSTLAGNRSRLLSEYLVYLRANPSTTQSNGLSGATVRSVCDLWTRLDPSSHEVFLTVTGRLWNSKLGVDDSAALSHVTKLYRLTGGQGGTPINVGSCGGAEFNRMIMAMDDTLHTALVDANRLAGNAAANGKFAISDSIAAGKWRNSRDAGGPHSPFTQSDETNDGAPRGQVHYFRDVTTAPATAPLSRMDLMTLVDPYALEMDQDYNCTHDSNPSCSYTTYGTLCFPSPSRLGTDLFTSKYGAYESDWVPVCR